uniref:Uncharacterized protein n=1 Tax=Ascaris lumbricoides TaxID=6252 RepID=A0A0M3I7M8_ASCLU
MAPDEILEYTSGIHDYDRYLYIPISGLIYGEHSGAKKLHTFMTTSSCPINILSNAKSDSPYPPLDSSRIRSQADTRNYLVG